MARSSFEIKTNEQIVLMRKAGLATAAALAAVRKAAKPGVSTLELDAIADATIQKHGGHSNFQLVSGYHHTICASINDEVVHGIPSSERILQAGDILSIDCGAEVGEWNGDAAITIIVPADADGKTVAPEILARRQHLSEVTEQSLWVGIAALANAKHLNDVGAAIEDYIYSEKNHEGKDFGILEDYVGHGVGRSMHEDPAVFNYRVRDKGPKVIPGLVVAIEPMVVSGKKNVKVLADSWTVATKDESDASHWEHTVAVHDTGIWVLTAEDGGAAKLAQFGIKPVALS